MNTAYSTARNSGLLPPLAAAIAAWQTTPTLAAQIRTLHPSGAAMIFVAAWLAGLTGSFAALAIVAAFLAGLYLVKAPMVTAAPPKSESPAATASPVTTEVVASAVHPLADQLAAAALVVREVKLARPAANGKVPKVAA
jgi:hypothetical protein